MGKVATQDTLLQIKDQLESLTQQGTSDGSAATEEMLSDINNKLKLLLTNNLHTIKNSGQMAEALFKELVQSGQAPSIFDIGDQITVQWDSTGDGTTQPYDYDMDVVSFESVTVTENGEPVSKPAMWLQSHNLLPTMAVSYSCPQAAAYVVNEITQPSGDDNFIYIILSWPIDSTNGRPAGIYYYKVPKDIPSIPAGSQITYSFAPNKALSVTVYNSSNASIISDTCTYTDQQSTINSLSGEKITITFGRLSTTIYPSEPDYKGNFFLPENFTGNYVVNDHLYNVLYGRGVWQTSDICKWLNSDAPAREWWKGHNIFARPPVDAWKNMPGFMFGLPSSFKKIIQQMSITTYFNGGSATSQQQQPIITKHFFFLPSATNEYITEGKNVYHSLEGHIFEYWKNLSTEPIGVDKEIAKNSPHRRFLISDKTRNLDDHCISTMLRSRANKDILNNMGYTQSSGTYQVKRNVQSVAQCGYAPVCVIY